MNTTVPLSTIVFLIVFLAYVFSSPIWLWLLIWMLRKSHAHHIYVIWYIFSFFFVLFFFLYVLAAQNNVNLEDVFGESGKAVFISVLGYMRDGEGEIKMVLAVVGLVVLPQWLTYVLSGLSGSASQPVFISQITDLAIWSLVKFCAAFAGIVLAEPAARWTMGSVFNSEAILGACGLLGTAFLLMWINHVARRAVDFLFRTNAFSSLRRVHEFFTRYSRHEEAFADPYGSNLQETTDGPAISAAPKEGDIGQISG